MITRQEAMNLTDLQLRVVADRLRAELRRAWDRAEPGKLSSIYDLALVQAEAAIRDLRLGPLEPEGWQRIPEWDWSQSA